MEIRIRHWFTVAVIGLLVVMSGSALGQVQNASLTGLVTDPSAAVISGATVTIKNTATNVAYTQKTEQSGYYLFPSLPVGAYTVSVEMAGFKKAVHNGVVLEVGQSARNDFTLEVGGVTEVVEVLSAVSPLETQQAAPSTV